MRLGPYSVIRPLGQGAFGSVFECAAPDGGHVAVKLLPSATPPAALARFEREKRLLGLLAEEGGVVPILDAGATSQGVYLVMPLVTGGTLRASLARGPMPVDEVVVLARDLAGAVARCHARGVVHRDLKPENVLLDDAGRPLVADLGLAKHFRLDAPGASQTLGLSRTGELRGTVGYAAPEQLMDAKAVGPPADVFALGAILYEALAGRPAFTGETLIDVIARTTEGPEEPLARARPDAPGWLVAVIERALAPAAADRFEDAGALRDALATPEAPATDAHARSTGMAPRALVAATLLLVVIGLAWSTRGSPGPDGTSSPVASPAPATPAPATPVPSTPSDAPARTDLDPALARVDALLARGELDVGLAEATRALESARGDPRAWLRRGRARVLLLDLAGAADDLLRATELDDRLAAAWALRAWALGARGPGRSQAALDCAERALGLDPDAAETWIGRSFARAEVDAALAAEDARRALGLAPADAQSHVALANALGTGGDWSAALVPLEAALALRPDDPHALTLRALARVTLGREPELAEADATRAIDRAPRATLALRIRARLRGDRGDLAGAEADLRAAGDADPRDPRPWRELANGFMSRDDRGGAEAAFDRLLAADPADARAWRDRGALRLARGDAGAADDYAQALELGLREPKVWLGRGMAELMVGRHGPAAACFEQVVALDPSMPTGWLGLCESRTELGELEAAGTAIERALALAPRNPSVFSARAQLRERTGDRAGALADYDRFLELARPEDPLRKHASRRRRALARE